MEHGESIEYDLIALGLRREWLGSKRLSWRDLLVIVTQSPAGTALDRALHGEAAVFTPTDNLLALMINVLQSMSWQLSGNDKAPKPKRFLLPGQTDPDATTTTKKLPGLTIEEVNRRLGWPNASTTAQE